MEAAMSHASFLLALLLFSPLTDGAAMPDACQEDAIMECLQRRVAVIVEAKALTDFNNLYKAMCTGKKESCTDFHARPDCPKDKKMELALQESSWVAAIDTLCENQGSLLKKLLVTFQCWNPHTFLSCVEQLALTATRLDFFTAMPTQKDLEVLKVELSKCVDRSRENSTECAQADVEPVERVIESFMERAVPGYSGGGKGRGNMATQAGSSFAAMLTIVLALAFTRRN
ncbi:uncharacterized protein LOC119441429 isoform X2 [Dermacentor silvarum]|uniref:uncharacterized protein LOC119441429 isoform X2 n=1 Tax=Dermacentor silvarum TaxID=543639 RepID=UPI00210100B0|nr:uncharacterized protein LOC119441429 isoform X2 [Dermacentor silvarum]